MGAETILRRNEMKRTLILLLVLLPCLPLAAIDMGIGADVNLGVDTYKEDASKASRTQAELMPAVVLRMSPQVEIRPYVVLGFDVQKDPDAITFLIADDSSAPYFGAGAGLYYAFIQRSLVSLFIGPKLEILFYAEPSGASAPVYERYFRTNISVTLPIYMDVMLKENLFLRGGLEIPGLVLDLWSYQQAGVKYVENTVTFADFWQAAPVLYFGFYYMFKNAGAS
jgi:hypothetical protein